MSRSSREHHAERRGEIQLGDLVRALSSLNWQGDDQAQAVARCLGFGVPERAAATRPPDEIFDRHRYADRPEPEDRPPAEPRVTVPPAYEPPVSLPAHTVPSRLTPLSMEGHAAASSADWLDEPNALYDDASYPAPARQSLFPERTNRHILSAALAVRREGHELDLRQLIQSVCRGAAVSRIPCRPEATLERGCHLLLDYSAAMVPFWEDLTGLITQVRDVVGESLTRVYSFDTRPVEARCWTVAGQREPWTADGRPVLAASDLGIQGTSARPVLDPSWAALIEACAKAASPLVILNPWPKQRWPEQLGSYPVIIHWGSHTSAALVRRHIGPGHAARHAAR